MDLVGYDPSDWSLDPNPSVAFELASEYMTRLSTEGRFDRLRGVRDRAGKIFETAASIVGRHLS